MPKLVLKGKWKYSRIYKALWEASVSAKAKLVWAALDWYGDKIFPSHDTLAQMCGLSVAGVKRAIEELQKASFLGKEGRIGMSNNYELFPDGNQVHLDLGHQDLGQKEASSKPDLGHSEPGSGNDLGHRDPLTSLKTSPTAKTLTTPPSPNVMGIAKRQFETWWTTSFQETFGEKFLFTSRDAKAARDLVGLFTLEELQVKVKAAWASPDAFVARRSRTGIFGFAEVVNQVQVQVRFEADKMKGYARG